LIETVRGFGYRLTASPSRGGLDQR
jgi:hypothetical protein